MSRLVSSCLVYITVETESLALIHWTPPALLRLEACISKISKCHTVCAW